MTMFIEKETNYLKAIYIVIGRKEHFSIPFHTELNIYSSLFTNEW